MADVLLVQGTAQRLPLADASVDVCICSPPYLGLRSYAGLAPEPWPAGSYVPVPGAAPVHVPAQTVCLGSEDTPAAYLWHLLLCLREMKRVTKSTACVWVNIGDSYANTPGNGRGGETVDGGLPHRSAAPKGGTGYPQGTLLGIPQQFMLAAIADGWLVRQECIYAKLSPMPESVRGWFWSQERCACLQPNRVINGQQGYATVGHREALPGGNCLAKTPATLAAPDCATCHGTGRTSAVVLRKGSWRHTRASESVFMLCKQMNYWSNGEAVKEASSPTTHGWSTEALGAKSEGKEHGGNGKPQRYRGYMPATRNPRNILTPKPSSLGLEHYAAFPSSLVEPLIRATCPERVCQCGAAWAPVVTQDAPPDMGRGTSAWSKSSTPGRPQRDGLGPPGNGLAVQPTTVHGLAPTCTCADGTPWQPGVCLDPFGGSGTVGLVSRALGRTSVLIEASPTYTSLARERLGLSALHEWQHGAGPVQETFTDLPLFGGA